MSEPNDLVLLTDAATPIFHNPCPTDDDSIEFKQRWKGYCLFEFYETGQMRLFDESEPKNELSRYVVVWNGKEPVSFMDGMWCEVIEWCDNAVLAPGTSEEVREAFRSWVGENPDNYYGVDSLNIDRKVTIVPVQGGTLEDAKGEIETLFGSFLVPQEQYVREA